MYGRGVVQIIQEPGPPRGNYIADITNKKSLFAKVKLFKVKVLYLTVYYYYCHCHCYYYCYYDDGGVGGDDDDNNVIHCNNFNEKYWAVVIAKVSIPLGDWDYRGPNQ